MHETVYSRTAWRELPRTECLIEVYFGAAAGECSDLIHRHHVDETDPYSRTIPVCSRHHPKLEAVLRSLRKPPEWKRCPHKYHRYPHAVVECERKLNAVR